MCLTLKSCAKNNPEPPLNGKTAEEIGTTSAETVFVAMAEIKETGVTEEFTTTIPETTVFDFLKLHEAIYLDIDNDEVLEKIEYINEDNVA